MTDFATALALVLVAQLPLVFKMWIDFKDRSEEYKREVYRIQLTALSALAHRLSHVYFTLGHMVTLAPVSDSDPEYYKETRNQVVKLTAEANGDLFSEIQRNEFVLPATIAVTLSDFMSRSSEMLRIAMGVHPNDDGPVARLPALWKLQEETFNVCFNQMRSLVGIDAISGDILRRLNPGTTHTLLQSSFSPLDRQGSGSSKQRKP